MAKEHIVKLKDGEESRTDGFCGRCNKQTETIWKRKGWELFVHCLECGMSYGSFEYYFMSDEEKKKQQTWMRNFGLHIKKGFA